MKRILNRILSTDGGDLVLTLIRLVLGFVMFPHGAQKVFGWFGGYGFEGTMGFFTQQMGLPWILGFLAILAESAGALGLITGFFSRIAAFGIAVNMVVAIFTAHLSTGFFMNWNGNLKGEGYEYHILALGLALAIIIRGAGAFSVDAKITEKTGR
jgi:putative oxidoreductase